MKSKLKIFHGKQKKAEKSVSMSVHSISGRLVNMHFLTQEDSVSLLRDIVRWQLRSASEPMRTKREETMVIECCKLKIGFFTHLVFAVNGGMGKECIWLYKRLAEMIADKPKAPISIVKYSIRTFICFSLLRSMIRCLKGSRSPRYSHTKDIDIKVNTFKLIK